MNWLHLILIFIAAGLLLPISFDGIFFLTLLIAKLQTEGYFQYKG